ncbi:MAG: N(G),N(G)-dimethylarginine dimethylaminohydrolase [Bacteroidetes bacterium 4484_249]|nr:MAG: N(G),N(G)-dimethylarginine dimethylaminohydrolase [Bacteroidetes bacterium 4484_249]
MFTEAIVRQPCKNIINGITSANLGVPDYNKAMAQHKQYVNALIKCGLDVIILKPDEEYPDSAFIEDTALLTPNCAVIMRPGAKSRKGETEAVSEVLKTYFSNIEEIKSPGTIEGGDIMMAGSHYYIGLSGRTNENGALQLIKILNNYGLTGSTIKLNNMLHLKTGLAYLENNNLLTAGEFINNRVFLKYNRLIIPEEENYAANCILVNDTVLVPDGYPAVKTLIKTAAYKILTVDISEFKKLDGGLSCLSLRF